MTDQGPKAEAVSYEQAREELISIVQRLESGGVPLEESLALWERGEQLASICQAWLDGARAKIEATRAGDQASAAESELRGAGLND